MTLFLALKMCKKWKHCCVRCNICNNIVTKQYKNFKIIISNLLLLASAIYIYIDAMQTLKGFISSKILHLCFYSLSHQFHMLDLLQLQKPGHLLSQPSRYEVLTYLFRCRDSAVILPKHASPVMLNEPTSASFSAVRLYALEFTGLKKWYLLVPGTV